MGNVVRAFSEVPLERAAPVGGKARALAELRQAGYPVPDGFVILPGAFEDDGLTAEAWNGVRVQLERLRIGPVEVLEDEQERRFSR